MEVILLAEPEIMAKVFKSQNGAFVGFFEMNDAFAIYGNNDEYYIEIDYSSEKIGIDTFDLQFAKRR